MDEQKKANIARLAQLEHDARERLNALGMMNANNQDPDYRLRLSQDFAVAEAELWNAQSKLRVAQMDTGTEPRPKT